MMKSILIALVCMLGLSLSSSAQLNPQSVSVPMRDGKFLAGDLYLPAGTGKFPVILIMTPYNKNLYKLTGLPFGIKYDITKSNYAILVVDWRCRFSSIPACALGSDNGDDGYDVVEWAGVQTWSTGKIGTWGPSALGNIQFNTAKKQPPHLVCAVPEVASPVFEYSKYFHGGVLEAASFKTLKEKLFPGSYDLVIKNPYYNGTWQFVENSTGVKDEIEVPMLIIDGWYDHNTTQNLEMLTNLRKESIAGVRGKHKLLMGPWVHGGSGQASLGTSFQGGYSFPNAAKWNDSFSMLFFDYYLRNVNNGWEKNAVFTYYQIGSNIWQTDTSAYAIVGTDKKWYLNSGNALTETVPANSGLELSYVYNPSDPSPTVGGKTLSDDLDQGPYDQSALVESRNDVLLFTSSTLTEDLVLRGQIKARLNVSSDKLDTDFVIRLTEVFPDGKSIQLEESILRMRYRNGFRLTDTAYMKKGIVYPIDLALDDIAYTFKQGSKIRLIISSSNYPLYNRNMNNGLEMYPGDKADSVHLPQIANNKVHFGSDYRSFITLPLTSLKVNSIRSEKAQGNMDVYPNPSYGTTLFISSLYPIMGYTIYDLNGKLLVQSNDYYPTKGIDVTGYAKGMYIIQALNQTKHMHISKFEVR